MWRSEEGAEGLRRRARGDCSDWQRLAGRGERQTGGQADQIVGVRKSRGPGNNSVRASELERKGAPEGRASEGRRGGPGRAAGVRDDSHQARRHGSQEGVRRPAKGYLISQRTCQHT